MQRSLFEDEPNVGEFPPEPTGVVGPVTAPFQRPDEATQREAVKRRAGTRLKHDGHNCYQLEGTGKGKAKKVHGLIDNRQGVYQTGGELKNFVYWKDRLVSLDVTVWQHVRDHPTVKVLEFIDHERNECWVVSADVANAHGKEYNAGIGTRWGIPMDCFDVIAQDGTFIRTHTKE